MGISRRFLNLFRDGSCRGTKGLVFNSATTPSRKLSTVGSGSKSFLNLIVDKYCPGITSLRLVDLRGQLFNTSTPSSTFGEVPESAAVQELHPAEVKFLRLKRAEVAELNMDWFELPAPIYSFQATGIPFRAGVDLFPLVDRKVLINYPSWGTFLFDVDTYHTSILPNLHLRQEKPISFFAPSADADDHLDGGGSLYILEDNPGPEMCGTTLSYQYEALVLGRPSRNPPCQSADCRLLPPLPFVVDPAYKFPYPSITAYASVGSDFYLSAEGVGTYRLDMLGNRWETVGNWTLPFEGKVEYVPELKLWFGLSAGHLGRLAAADLSDMDSQPQLVPIDSWKELELRKEWMLSDSQLVNLGSGRFCIANFFYTLLTKGDSLHEQNQILVLSGVEVTSPVQDGNHSGNCTGEVKLAIRQHKSKCYISDHTRLLTVF